MPKTLSIHGVIVLAALGLGGCSLSRSAPEPPMAEVAAKGGGDQALAPSPGAPAPGAPAAGDAAKQNLPKTSRKVIRNAELAIEVASPAAAESQVSSLVERLGGYVASAEREVSADEGSRSEARVNLSLRVPAERMDEALREIKRMGGGAETEKIGSSDVTDEYIDVEAHITNQRHLEQQLVSILGKATDVDSTLKVHHELTTVRTEIDRLEGRKRFLDTETALAKISLSLSPLRPVVVATSNEFSVSVRRAASDSVAVAAAVVTFTIRAAGVLLPLSLMFGVPALGIVLFLRRRQRKVVAALSG